jgi:creatinine amidohydrolase
MIHRMELMSWTDFDQMRSSTDLSIIPVGAVEVYGPHLPLGSDSLVAQKVAEMLAERCGAVIAPLVPVGYSRKLSDFPGTLWVKGQVLSEYLRGICIGLIEWGFKRLLFLNTHLGNVGPISELAEEIQILHGVRCVQVDWWRFVQGVAKDITETSHPFGHAGEVCASVLMYLWPDLVQMDKATSEESPEDLYQDIIKYPRHRELTASGVIGDPKKASEEKGRLIITRALDRLVKFLEEAFH